MSVLKGSWSVTGSSLCRWNSSRGCWSPQGHTSGKEELPDLVPTVRCVIAKKQSQLVLPGIGSALSAGHRLTPAPGRLPPSSPPSPPTPSPSTLPPSCLSKQAHRGGAACPGRGLANSQVGHQETHSNPKPLLFMLFTSPWWFLIFSFSDVAGQTCKLLLNEFIKYTEC